MAEDPGTQRDSGFPPIARTDARCLVLGSMPSRQSLAQQQYYAHPRNAFWPVMEAMLGFEANAPYARRADAVQAAGIALWDVIATCRRPGSLDADIDETTMEVNDFATFFRRHSAIEAVFFNGQKARQVFQKHALPALPLGRELFMTALPSTSPAHASLDRAAKLRAWRAALRPYLEIRP